MGGLSVAVALRGGVGVAVVMDGVVFAIRYPRASDFCRANA